MEKQKGRDTTTKMDDQRPLYALSKVYAGLVTWIKKNRNRRKRWREKEPRVATLCLL